MVFDVGNSIDDVIPVVVRGRNGTTGRTIGCITDSDVGSTGVVRNGTCKNVLIAGIIGIEVVIGTGTEQNGFMFGRKVGILMTG